MKTIIKSLITIVAVLLVSCTTTPPEGAKGLKYLYGGNDCLPQAIAMTSQLQDKGIDASVVIISSKDGKFNHAICRYVYPRKSINVWGWDAYWGSTCLRAYKNDPQAIANAWMIWSANQDKMPVTGTLLEDLE